MFSLPVPPSTLPMRLLTTVGDNTPYIGRLQVYHDESWGNVCNDFFGSEEADLACVGLNYTEGAICYATSPFQSSTGFMIVLMYTTMCSWFTDVYTKCVYMRLYHNVCVYIIGTDPMWLDDVDCSNADRFQDCTHRGWGIHNCFSTFDGIGLICNPGTSS